MYRNLIGQLNFNKARLKKIQQTANENTINNKKLPLKSCLSKRQQNLDFSRSVSLNDLISAANELIIKEKSLNKKKINNAASSMESMIEDSIIWTPQANTAMSSNEINENIEKYRCKLKPYERLELDISPTFIKYSNNKLLIASSNAKIRIFDLLTNKIEKDEINNVLITSICMPIIKNNEILFAITNGEFGEENDEFDLSNSVIIVTKKELQVLKKDSQLNSNDDYIFLNPCGLSYDKFNNLYICDSGYNRVKILDSNLILTETIETASSLNQPKSLCICHEKSLLFVCDSGNHRIISYDILNDGKKFLFKNVYGYGYGEELGKMRFPLDCSVDNFGFLIIRDHHNNRIKIFSSNTMLIHTINFDNNNENIYSLTASEKGDIFVAKMTQVQELNSFSGQIANVIKYFIDVY